MTTINKKEIDKFDALSQEWWDVNGKFKPLHQFNPIRLELIINYIKNIFTDKLRKQLYNAAILSTWDW